MEPWVGFDDHWGAFQVRVCYDYKLNTNKQKPTRQATIMNLILSGTNPNPVKLDLLVTEKKIFESQKEIVKEIWEPECF